MSPLQQKALLAIFLGRGDGLSAKKGAVSQVLRNGNARCDTEGVIGSLVSAGWVEVFDAKDETGLRLRIKEDALKQAVGWPVDLFDEVAVCVPRVCASTARAENVSETFNRSDVSTIKRSTLEGRVRAFVGDDDWFDKNFWNGAQGWRARLFTEEGMELEQALNYVEAGLKSGEVRLRKTRGAMLWNEFQRRRRPKVVQGTSL